MSNGKRREPLPVNRRPGKQADDNFKIAGFRMARLLPREPGGTTCASEGGGRCTLSPINSRGPASFDGFWPYHVQQGLLGKLI